MTTTTGGGTLISLPFDLVTEILCRLPVKQLIQLCCVCKSWNSLISHDSQFAKKHLRFSTSCELFLSDSAISSIFTSPSTTTSFTQLSHPIFLNLNNGYYGTRVSTCHGMLCIRIDQSYALLCNPSTNNYKIISLSSDDNHHIKQVNVHTLGADYWTNIHNFPKHYLIPRPGIFVSDTANWLAYDRRRSFARIILSLDLENELCQDLSHPFYDNQSENSITLEVLRDCLCILSNSDKFSHVWIMKEYGNGQSWTKLLRVPQMGDPGFYHHTRALYISQDDQVLMYFLKMEKFILAVYDSINDTFKIPDIQNKINDLVPEVYVESLISPFSRY